MTTNDAAAKEATAAETEPQATTEAPAEETVVSAPAEPEISAENDAEKPASNPPKKRGRKRKVSVTEDKTPASEDASVAENAEAAPSTDAAAPTAEKSPKGKKTTVKKAKVATPGTPTKRKVGRPRKIVKEESESEDDDTMSSVHKRVDALPDDIKAKFGSIVWAKMVGFPYWPALITDPRRLDAKYHATAIKDIETKYYVCFYQSNDFSPVLFKNIEAWDDNKHDYRTGHPTKDAKAPKRRSNLLIAIEEADKDAPLPMEERMNGLMKELIEEVESSPEEEKPVVVKRKVGRPLGSKNKPKPTSDAAGSTETPSPAPKAKRGRKKAAEKEEADDSAKKTAIPETPEEDEEAPPLSKDEIKAKVASRKTPSKKKAPTAEEKSAAAAAKKAAKASAKSEPTVKGELDSKRKKEIELVVPRKSVKSSDIREATEEAARKKPGPREKPKDKGEYKVGSLTTLAGKMNRLFANESSKNNDELILLLTQLFEEKMVYRSDVERSGVAAVIAALRKSQNPTVAQTASGVRKHLMRVLNDDVTNEAASSRKQKAEVDAEPKASKKQKTNPPSEAPATSPTTTETKTPAESQANGSSAPAKEERKVEVKADAGETQEAAKEEPKVEVTTDGGASEASPAEGDSSLTAEEPVQTQGEVAKQEPTEPVKSDPAPASTSPKPDPSGDKSRMTCIDMLKKALAPIGARSEEIARMIEAEVFGRFGESNEDYKACARSITFGLKKNANARERLNNGDLHALELAYSPEDILKS